MESILVLVFISILALMVVGVLYGERLSLLGLFDGEWFSPIGVLAAKIWDGPATVPGIRRLARHRSLLPGL